MDPELTEKISRRPAEERARKGLPEGAPVLPPVPAARYVDPSFAAIEREAVFGRSWLFVAHADEIPNPGDYLALDQFEAPLFLLRGADGVIRALFNSCRHRGGPVFPAPRGNAGKGLVCGYHGWSYALDGSLAGIPRARDFGPLDRACLGLRGVRCESWGPFVFVTFDPEAPPLVDELGIVGEDLGPQLADGERSGPVHLIDRRFVDVDANWKLIVDANVETYHVETLHVETAAPYLDSAATGIFLHDGGHSRMLVAFREGVSFPIDLPPFPQASPLADQGIYSYHLFPNTSIVFGGSRRLAFLISSWPLAPDRSRFDVRFLAAVPADGPHADLIRTIVDANWTVFREDISTLPSIQRSISTGTIDALRLSWPERRIAHQHEEIDRRIGHERIPPPLRVEPVLDGFRER